MQLARDIIKAREMGKELIYMGIAELTAKIESLSAEDYNMVIMLVNRLSEKSENNGLRRLSENELVEELSASIKKVTLEQQSQQEQFQRT